MFYSVSIITSIIVSIHSTVSSVSIVQSDSIHKYKIQREHRKKSKPYPIASYESYGMGLTHLKLEAKVDGLERTVDWPLYREVQSLTLSL